MRCRQQSPSLSAKSSNADPDRFRIVELGDHGAMEDDTSFRARIRWIRDHLHSRRRTAEFRQVVEEVVVRMEEALQHDFPSPRGMPVAAGRFVGTNPVRMRVRFFPRGARVGRLDGRDQFTWMKPALIGQLVGIGGGTTLTYFVSAQDGEVVAAGSLMSAVLSLLVALSLRLSGATGSLVCLAAAAVFSFAFCVMVVQAEQGIREERLLLEWLGNVEHSLGKPS
jgi:hypothetical protein